VSSTASGRYELIWITYLPPMPGSSSRYQAQIYNVSIRGNPGNS